MAIDYSKFTPDLVPLLATVTLKTVTLKIDDMMTRIEKMVSYCSEDLTTGIITIKDSSSFTLNNNVLNSQLSWFYDLDGYALSQTLKADIATEYVGTANEKIKFYIIDHIRIWR